MREQSFSEVASELLIIYGTGTVIGPPLAVALMRHGARHLFLFMWIVMVFLAVFTGIRLMRRARPVREAARMRACGLHAASRSRPRRVGGPPAGPRSKLP